MMLAIQGLLSSLHRLLPSGGAGDDDDSEAEADPRFAVEHEELPYKVEVWDRTGAYVEFVSSVSSSSAVGYAAYYAAAREHPERQVTLTLKGRVLSRWSPKSH